MFQERLPTLSIRRIKSGKHRKTNLIEFLDDFVMMKARIKTYFNCILCCVRSDLIR